MRSREDRIESAREYAETVRRVLRGLPWDAIGRLLAELERAYRDRRTVFVAGNGGSAATASHLANDLMRGIEPTRVRGFRTISLCDNTPLVTAIANDDGYDEVFAKQIDLLGRRRDVLIVFSGSGKSRNILRALAVAREKHLTTLAFLGMGGGPAAALADVSVVVPSGEYEPIEDAHDLLHHLVTVCLRSWIRKEPRRRG